MDETSLLLERLLLWVVVPLWMAMGFLDWACHRIQRIEHSAGLKESWLHLAMLGQLGLGMGAALAFQPTAALLAFLGMVCLAHEVTTWWDLRYAQSRRVIPTYEQWVHAWQLVIPWVAWAMLLLAHRNQALALVGEGPSPAGWHFALRDPLPPLRVWLALGSGAAVLVIGPFLAEHARCRAAAATGEGIGSSQCRARLPLEPRARGRDGATGNGPCRPGSDATPRGPSHDP